MSKCRNLTGVSVNIWVAPAEWTRVRYSKNRSLSMKRGKNGECQGFVDRRRQSRGCTDGMSVCTAREESVAFSDAKKEMFDGGGETHKAT